jgi:Domain of unknown function (DUF4383)
MTTDGSHQKRRIYTGLLAVQSAAVVVGAAFLLIGILGFVPGITTHLNALQLAGHRSGALLFDIFAVSVLHNLIHIAVGIAGLILARSYVKARAYLLGGGLLFVGAWIWGLFLHPADPANVLPLNNADNWLHLGIGVTMIVLALTLAGARVPTGSGGEILVPPS